MNLSVVVVTLNGRDALSGCLDALAAAAPAAERIVVNGPSADGTTGMVRARDDVDVLLELADRNVNVARNAGVEAATGDAIAFVDQRTTVGGDWGGGVTASLREFPVVTGPVGPVGRPASHGPGRTRPERERFGQRDVTFFDGANVALHRTAVEAIDGFDEYLDVGGSRDAAHRLASLGHEVAWSADLQAGREAADPPPMAGDSPGRQLRAVAYRLAKNYGPEPHVLRRLSRAGRREAAAGARAVLSGDVPVSRWLSDGATTAGAGCRGVLDGVRARYGYRRPSRNPRGVSSRRDRVVERYEWP